MALTPSQIGKTPSSSVCRRRGLDAELSTIEADYWLGVCRAPEAIAALALGKGNYYETFHILVLPEFPDAIIARGMMEDTEDKMLGYAMHAQVLSGIQEDLREKHP